MAKYLDSRGDKAASDLTGAIYQAWAANGLPTISTPSIDVLQAQASNVAHLVVGAAVEPQALAFETRQMMDRMGLPAGMQKEVKRVVSEVLGDRIDFSMEKAA